MYVNVLSSLQVFFLFKINNNSNDNSKRKSRPKIVLLS